MRKRILSEEIVRSQLQTIDEQLLRLEMIESYELKEKDFRCY